MPVSRLISASLAVALAAACGPSQNPPPAMIGLTDHVAFVGSELFVELRASDPDLEILRFSFDGTAPDISSRAVLEHTGNGSALFRWTPLASDVGTWAFDFKVTDGNTTTTETIVIEVRPIADGAPIFRRPLAVGATLDLEQARCLELAVEVEDPDTPTVRIKQAEPVIAGAELVQTGDTTAVWSWCPSPEQIEFSDRHILALSASDGENEPTVKHFLIVLRGGNVPTAVDLAGFQLTQNNSTCSVQFPVPTLVEPGATLVIVRDAERAEFEAFWGVTLAEGTLFINSRDTCPRINGGETYALLDAAGATVDGLTPALTEHTTLSRRDPTAAAGEEASWSIAADTAGASPGVHDSRAPGSGALYISEVSDASGTGNFVFEFVEISVD